MEKGDWNEDLSRAMGTDLADLLADDNDDALLGAGLLAWLARVEQGKLMKPGIICALSVRISGGKPAELEILAIRHDGVARGPWTIMLCPAGHTGEMTPWTTAIASRSGGPTRSKWLQGGSPEAPTPHEFLADRADLLRIDHASLGTSLRPAMAAVASRQGVAKALLFGVALAGTLANALQQNVACLTVRSSEVRLGDEMMGDWCFQCARRDHLGLSHDDTALRADTSTLEGVRKVLEMLEGDAVITSIELSYEGDQATGVAAMGRVR